MKLLHENAQMLKSYSEIKLNESAGTTDKTYFIEGNFATVDGRTRNRNGRLYPRFIWEKAIKEWSEETIKRNVYHTLSEFEHPDRYEVSITEAVAKIDYLLIEGDYLKGKMRILNNNSPVTNQIKALIDAGFQIGVSTRGIGDLNEDKVVTEYRLSTVDIVASPSDYSAMTRGLTESVEKEYDIDPNTNEVVEIEICSDNKCMLVKQDELEDAVLKKFNSIIQALASKHTKHTKELEESKKK